MYQIDVIADILDATPYLTLGKDLFIYHAPAEVENCVILFPSNDPPIIDPDAPGYFKGKFQAIVRATEYSAGINLCKQMAVTLSFGEQTRGNIYIKYLRPLYQARVFRRSESGTLEMSVGYEVCFVTN